MAEIVGIRFKKASRVYYFDPVGIDLEANDYVVVQTTRGLKLGHVVIAPKQVLVSEVKTPLKPIVRKAEPEDISRAQELESKEGEALIECGRLIAQFNLPMKLLSAEYNLDGNRLTIFFSAAERVVSPFSSVPQRGLISVSWFVS
jgi:cell fate regulator YaaT (PSP1 superfamily)